MAAVRLTVSGHQLEVHTCDGNERRMWRVYADGQHLGVVIDNLCDFQPAPLYRYGPTPVIHCATQRLALETLVAETIDHQGTP